MPQLSYSLSPNPGTPGMLYDCERSSANIVTGIAGAVIPPGSICEFINSGGSYVAVPLKDTGTTTGFLPSYAGIALLDTVGAEQKYVPYAVPNVGGGSTFPGYPVGMPVSFVRRGRIWTMWDGSNSPALPLPMGAMQVWHSSDGSTLQGVVTTLNASASLHSEIDTLPATFQFYDPRQVSGSFTDAFGNTNAAVVMSVNLPGHS